MIRVLLVDDHASFRQPLAFMLEREPDMTVVGQAGTLADARPLVRETDVAVIDVNLPDGSGTNLIPVLRAGNPHAAALVLSASQDRRDVAAAVEVGAAGVMHKSASIGDIIIAIRRVAQGEVLLSVHEAIDLLRFAARQRAQNLESTAALKRITPREMEVLQALADGLSDKEIAERLSVSNETVRTHMVNILRKLGVSSRLQALIYAVRHGVVRIKQ